MNVTYLLLAIFTFAQMLSLLLLFQRPWKKLPRRTAIGNVIATISLWLILDAFVVTYLISNGVTP